MIKNWGKLAAIGMVSVAVGLAVLLIVGYQASAHESKFRAQLRDPSGQIVGTVDFRIGHHAMKVDAKLRPNRYLAPGQFHGFHVHANNDPANGQGCRATPGDPASTWFVSADGHLSATGQSHGAHHGDLPSPLVLADGTARLRFTTDRIDPGMLRGRVVILHANPDNYGNVPVGSGANQYSPNSSTAPDVTARTGNAGDRVACGLLQRYP
jgi:superoxide dismutase, Cu-Zn family